MKNFDHATTSSSLPKYNLVNWLLKTPAHISIFELLQIFLKHKEILTKALVPTDLDMSRFQNMVRIFVSPHCISFSTQDDMSIIQPQNSPLHIEVFILRNRVKRALVDGGAGPNICTLNLVKALGYTEDVVDPRKKITIKAYDDEERSSRPSYERNCLSSLGPIINLQYPIGETMDSRHASHSLHLPSMS